MNIKKVSCNSFCCLGSVIPPSSGTSVTFMPGSTGKIVWSFTDDIKNFSIRSWTFTPSDGRPQVGLARIIGYGAFLMLTTSYEVEIEKPATLVLKNINLNYNGTYKFSLSPSDGPSDVVVYIAGKLLIMSKLEPFTL